MVEVHGNKAPDDKIEQGSIKYFHETRQAAFVEKKVTENECAYAVTVQ